jgi:hypothetical protein
MAETTRTEAERTIARALDKLSRVYEEVYAEARNAIEAISDTRQAFEVANSLVTRVNDLYNAKSANFRQLRGQQAKRRKDALETSVAGLAKDRKVSKARAGQWVKDAEGE